MKPVILNVAGTPWTLSEGECWVITGPMGCGKSTLGARLSAQLREDAALVSFSGQAASAGSDWAAARFHSFVEYNFITVRQALTFERINGINPFEVRPPETERRAAFDTLRQDVVAILQLESLMTQWTGSLSNGEQRRLMLACAILKQTPVLILDDPFAGLDTAMQDTFRAALARLAEAGRTLVLMLRNEDEIPPCANRRLMLSANRTIISQGTFRPCSVRNSPLPNFTNPPPLNTPEVFALRNLTFGFNGTRLFNRLNWTVHAGEHWLLVGPNGSGKTTLLSLIRGDNPMMYAINLTLFGQKPGPGVPLWSFRSRMALVSPEEQAGTDLSRTVMQSACSGLFDREGSRLTPTPAQRHRAEDLLKELGLYEHRNDTLATLSAGMIRLVLVVRALLPNPDLLLLDELCMNLERAECDLLLRHLTTLLDATPGMAVVCIAHRADHIPTGFDRMLRLRCE